MIWSNHSTITTKNATWRFLLDLSQQPLCFALLLLKNMWVERFWIYHFFSSPPRGPSFIEMLSIIILPRDLTSLKTDSHLRFFPMPLNPFSNSGFLIVLVQYCAMFFSFPIRVDPRIHRLCYCCWHVHRVTNQRCSTSCKLGPDLKKTINICSEEISYFVEKSVRWSEPGESFLLKGLLYIRKRSLLKSIHSLQYHDPSQ